MTPRRVAPLLRSLAPTDPGIGDAELLGRFTAARDESAFAALVDRHGRLVWAVCRHLAGPDADDAFQATFLVLLKNAGRVRAPASLAAWLHGVAYRVSAKARRAARRRAGRERAAAVPDRHAGAVPDSAWDRALAAVHEEVARLPEALRVPFVLCALDGRGVTEAAGQLGWKVTTLSARLGRAKETLLARLQARGLAAGAVVALAIAAEAVPAAAARSAAAAARGGAVSGTVQTLTHGVVGMSAYQVKLLAAGVVLALGLGAGGGAGWLAPAGAQQPGARAVPPEEKVRRLEDQLEQAKRELADQQAAERRREADEVARLATGHWQYAFVPVKDVDAERFVKLLAEREAGGWDYAGQTTLKKEAVWAFRRPAQGRPRTAETRPAGNFGNGAANSLEYVPDIGFPIRGNPGGDPNDARSGGNKTAPGAAPADPRKQ